MTVTNVWVGGVTQDSALVVTKVSSGSDVRVEASLTPGFSSSTFFGPVTPTAENIARVQLSSLNANARYYYRVEHDGVIDTTFPGQFKTYPLVNEPASFMFSAATCAGGAAEFPGVGSVLAASRISNHPVFATIMDKALAEDHLFFFHGGDMNYYDLNDSDETHGIVGGGSLANYRRAYDDVLLQPNQHGLYRNVPIVYSCGGGGHDWGQPIGLARTLPGRNNCLQAWRERVPYHPTADPAIDAGTYRSFQVGRVLFIVTDENADRDPDSETEGPTKTKLGAAQKLWLEQTLTNTSAEALVWLSGAQWERGGSGNWGRYITERFEIQQMLGNLNWLDRMVFITGDRHALEIVEAEDNVNGGFPIWHFASLDSPGTGSEPDGSTSGGNNRYGTVQVLDDGDQITLVGTAFIGTDIWKTDSLVIQVSEGPPPIPPPTPLPTAVARARLRRHVTWYGCDLVSGRVIAELPDTMGSVSRIVGAYTNTQLTVPVPGGGYGSINTELIRQATTPRRTMMVNVINDIPAWGGMVLTRKGGTSGTIDLGLASLESYLDHRYVGSHSWTNQDVVSVMAAGLIGDAEDEGIGFIVDAPASGILRDRQYFDYDDATVYSRLTELAAATGIEWTIDLDWTDDGHQVIQKIIRVYPRIGVDYGGSPPAVFQALGGSVFSSEGVSDTVYTLTEEHTRGRSANHIVATSSGQGEDRPASAAARDEAALLAGAPRFEMRFTPSTSIINVDVLDEHALAELERRKNGAQLWTIESRWDAYPRYGVDWQLGDDVAWQVKGHWHPQGIKGIGRAIGWELDVQSGKLGLILREGV